MEEIGCDFIEGTLPLDDTPLRVSVQLVVPGFQPGSSDRKPFDDGSSGEGRGGLAEPGEILGKEEGFLLPIIDQDYPWRHRSSSRIRRSSRSKARGERE
jgi:hypothetical protein